MDVNFTVNQPQVCNFSIAAVISQTFTLIDGLTITENPTYGILETQTI